MRYQVTRKVRFESAHFLPDYDGACQRLHGHSYTAHVTVTGDRLQSDGGEAGMLIDMGTLGAYFKEHLEPMLDHQVLNETLPQKYHPVTAENIALFLFDEFGNEFSVASVTVWETENQAATVCA